MSLQRSAVDLTRQIRADTLAGEPAAVIGTCGFSRLFEREELFNAVLPDLALIGLERALALNPGASRPWTPPTPM